MLETMNNRTRSHYLKLFQQVSFELKLLSNSNKYVDFYENEEHAKYEVNRSSIHT